jgi:hypothetical protein
MTMQNESDRAARTSDVERARSTPLRPAIWMTSVLVWATVVALFLRVPSWAGVFLCTLTGASFVLFLVGYVYLFATDREALRAERYRARPVGTTSQDVPGRQTRELGAGRGTYIEPERAGFGGPRPDEGEYGVRVAEAGRAREE